MKTLPILGFLMILALAAPMAQAAPVRDQNASASRPPEASPQVRNDPAQRQPERYHAPAPARVTDTQAPQDDQPNLQAPDPIFSTPDQDAGIDQDDDAGPAPDPAHYSMDDLFDSMQNMDTSY